MLPQWIRHLIIVTMVMVGCGAPREEEVGIDHQEATSAWWCGTPSDTFLVQEIVNSWSPDGNWQQPGSGPLHPVLPPMALPAPAIPWVSSAPAVFMSSARRHAFWASASPGEVGNYLETTADRSYDPWSFVNWSTPTNAGYFVTTSTEETGQWWYRWDNDTYILGRIDVSRPLTDTSYSTARETYIGRRVDRSGSGHWEQKTRITCLYRSQIAEHPLDPLANAGTGYADLHETNNVALVRTNGCWSCMNY